MKIRRSIEGLNGKDLNIERSMESTSFTCYKFQSDGLSSSVIAF